ncbi:MAG: radical SAM/SPASM domain-containing protein [Thermoplasmatota archaeon]
MTEFSLKRFNRIPTQLWTPMCRHPRLFLRMMRGIYRKYWLSKRDYWRPDGSSDSLWMVSIRITHRCNHRCAICGQWGERGYNRVAGAPKVMGEVPVEVYKRVVDEVVPRRAHIYITGGEPFMYAGLVPLADYMKRRGLSVQVVTNGVGLERSAEEIVRSGWDMLCVSLDGPREIHDRCRGLKGAFETMERGVRRVQEVKRRMRRRRPVLYTLTTISETNQGVLLETLREAQKLRPDLMAVYYSWFTSEALGRKHAEVMRRALGVEPFAWKSYARDTSGLDPDLIARQVEMVKAAGFDPPVMFIPQIETREIADYYRHPENFLGWKRCLAPWFQVDIMPNGDVVNCRDFPDIVMGNIKEKPLLEIYNGERFRAFRRALRSAPDGVFPICSRCCGLMGY